MLKTMILRKKYERLQSEATNLRTKQAGFKTREGEVAAMVEAAKSDEEIAAATAAVEELESVQKTTKDRLLAIQEECEALLQEIENAEAAAATVSTGDGDGDDGEDRSCRSRGADYQKRCRDFQRTGKTTYRNVSRMLHRASLLTSSTGVEGPTGVSGINDPVGNTVSDFLDLVKVADCTGMASYKIVYVTDDASADTLTEGTIPTESSTAFATIELKPNLFGLISYISKEIRKQSPLLYAEKVEESVRKALRKVLSKMAVEKVLSSTINDTMEISAETGAELFTPTLLSNIILAYGGDEGVDGAATLVLNKADLKAFAAVRGTNEYLPVYSIVPDPGNPSAGVIKDNNGLSCRYCLNKNVAALSTETLSETAKKGMFYGNPQCLEMGMWGDLEVEVSDGYKFGEGLLTIRGEVSADAGVNAKHGFVVVSAKKSA